MIASELIQALHSDSTVFGTLIVSPSPRWPSAVRGCGLDFVFIDTEHIALDREQLSWMCQTYSALGLAPLLLGVNPDIDKVVLGFGRKDNPIRWNLHGHRAAPWSPHARKPGSAVAGTA